MYNLIIKDFLLQKKLVSFYFIYAIVICFSAVKVPNGPAGFMYVFFIIICTYLSVMFSNQYEQKRDSEVILNSLPVNRNDIVLSKYLYIGVLIGLFSVSLSVISVIFSFIFNGNIDRIFHFSYLVIAFVVIGIVYSIYYPLYFKLGKTKIRLVTLFLYILMFMLPSGYTNLMTNNQSYFFSRVIPFVESNFNLVLICLTLITSMLLTASYEITSKIYKRKEF